MDAPRAKSSTFLAVPEEAEAARCDSATWSPNVPVGADHRVLLPASALAGAVLLVVADTLARVVIAPTELPVGIITAIIGVPFFVSLLRQRHHYGMQA